MANEHNPFEDYPNCSLTNQQFTTGFYIKSISSFWTSLEVKLKTN